MLSGGFPLFPFRDEARKSLKPKGVLSQEIKRMLQCSKESFIYYSLWLHASMNDLQSSAKQPRIHTPLVSGAKMPRRRIYEITERETEMFNVYAGTNCES